MRRGYLNVFASAVNTDIRSFSAWQQRTEFRPLTPLIPKVTLWYSTRQLVKVIRGSVDLFDTSRSSRCFALTPSFG